MFTSSKPSILLVLYIFCFHEEPCFWHCSIFIIIMAILVLDWIQRPSWSLCMCLWVFQETRLSWGVSSLTFSWSSWFWFWCKTQNLKVFNVYWSHIFIIVVLVLNSKALVQMIFLLKVYNLLCCNSCLCLVYNKMIMIVVMLLQNIQQFWIGTIHNVLFKTMTIDVQ